MNTKKLLQITLKYYILFASAMVLLSVPLFFVVSNQLYLHETDEALVMQKNQFQILYANKLKINQIATFNSFNRDIKIFKNNQIKNEQLFYTRNYYNPIEKENEPYRFISSPIKIDNQNFLFSSRINLVDSYELSVGILIIFIVFLVFLLVGFLFITKKLSAKLWQPFYTTLQVIENFEIDTTTETNLKSNSVEEFNRLNTALNKLIAKNKSIFQSQKVFIENAAHELQTPIAIFKAQIETILQDQNISENQFQLLEEVNETASKLKKLNKNLLLLSKLHSSDFVKNENVNFSEIIRSQFDFFKEQAASQNVSITIDLPLKVEVKSNQFLCEVLIRNLFANAVNHNVKNGKVLITATENSLIFSNTAKQNALEKDKLYQRFSKLTTASKGNGLGLSIIKNIVEIQNWQIHYFFENNNHRFEIGLK